MGEIMTKTEIIKKRWENFIKSTKLNSCSDHLYTYTAGYKDAIRDKRKEAAEAVIDRWHTPSWKDVPATGEFIYKLEQTVKERTI
jgi:hypothetical protein